MLINAFSVWRFIIVGLFSRKQAVFLSFIFYVFQTIECDWKRHITISVVKVSNYIEFKSLFTHQSTSPASCKQHHTDTKWVKMIIKGIGINHEYSSGYIYKIYSSWYSCRIWISYPRDQKLFASVTRLYRVTLRKFLFRGWDIHILYE